jgi:hypothetical protein
MIIRPARRDDLPEIVAIYASDELVGAREFISDPLPRFYLEAFDSIAANPTRRCW